MLWGLPSVLPGQRDATAAVSSRGGALAPDEQRTQFLGLRATTVEVKVHLPEAVCLRTILSIFGKNAAKTAASSGCPVCSALTTPKIGNLPCAKASGVDSPRHPARVPMNPDSFVHVSAGGTHFEVNGAPFYFAGANCYYLMVGASLSLEQAERMQTNKLVCRVACPCRHEPQTRT